MKNIMYLATLFLTISVSGGAWADPNLTEIPPKEAAKIEKHGACRVVYNTGSSSIMVPTKLAEEWAVGANAFLNNVATMEGVKILACDTIVSSNMVKEGCYPGALGTPSLDCLRPDGPHKGEQVPYLPNAGEYWFLDTRPRCIFWNQGPSDILIHVATHHDLHGLENEHAPFSLVKRLISNQFPVDTLMMPPGADECVLNVQYTYKESETVGGSFYTYVFRR